MRCDVLVMWNVMIYDMVCHVVWRFCGGSVREQLFDSILSGGCFLLHQGSVQCFKRTNYRNTKIALKDELDLCDEIDLISSMVCLQE